MIILLVCNSLISIKELYHETKWKTNVFNDSWIFFFAHVALESVVGRCVFGCSICTPFMSYRYCYSDKASPPDPKRGHWYTLCSSHLYSRMMPSFSQYKPLIWSRRCPQNRGNALGNGSNSKHAPTVRCRGNLVFVPPTPAASHDVSALRLSFWHPIMAVTERCATFRYYCLWLCAINFTVMEHRLP